MLASKKANISDELSQLQDRRDEIDDIDAKVAARDDRQLRESSRELKKNYAERFSRLLAQRFADVLREFFPGILPDANGKFHESIARASKRPKKLDVNYSNPEIGLGLGLSIKTINFRDPKNRRYTKNYTRVDNEWRAEASDYHVRQPYAVMAGVLFLPRDSVADGIKTHSSFAQAVNIFRHRCGRKTPRDDAELFECTFLGLYEKDGASRGDVQFFDASKAPPRNSMPDETMDLDGLIRRICEVYDDRNAVEMKWKDGEDAVGPMPMDEVMRLQEIDEEEGVDDD